MSMKEQKEFLGPLYRYQQWMDDREVMEVIRRGESFEGTAASLTMGCVRIDAVVFPAEGGLRTGYDVLVREDLSSEEWICYDSPGDAVSTDEERMLSVLERVVEENGLSYTDPSFPQLQGKKQSLELKMEL